MMNLSSWILETTRREGITLGWLEERRFELAPVIAPFISAILEGYGIILCADNKRKWFKEFIISNINSLHRPLIPIFSFDSPDTNNIELVYDMLGIALPKYFIWFIGSLSSKNANLALNYEQSMIWSFDESAHNAFIFQSSDHEVDIKLIWLFKVINNLITSSMVEEIDLTK